MFPFCGIFAISLELVCCTESVQQRNHWLVTKRVFFDRFCDQLNVSFVALTQCDKQISMKWQLMPKKGEDIVTVLKQLD